MKIIINNIIADIKVGYLPTERVNWGTHPKKYRQDRWKRQKSIKQKAKKYGGKKVEVLISANLWKGEEMERRGTIGRNNFQNQKIKGQHRLNRQFTMTKN